MIDLANIQESIDAIDLHEQQYINAYSDYAQAMRDSATTLIRLLPPDFDADAIAAYEHAIEVRIKAGRALDDEQIERIGSVALFGQLTKMILNEIMPLMAELKHRVDQLEISAMESSQP